MIEEKKKQEGATRALFRFYLFRFLLEKGRKREEKEVGEEEGRGERREWVGKKKKNRSDVARGPLSLPLFFSFLFLLPSKKKKTRKKLTRHGLFCSQRLRSRRHSRQQRCVMLGR